MNYVTPKSAILEVLISGDGYGLDIIDRVAERTDGAIKLHQGSVYPALRALEREGLVESYDGPPLPERGGRPRRYYKLTALGARKAQEQRLAVRGLFGLALGMGAAG